MALKCVNDHAITLSKNPYTRVPNKSVQMGSSTKSANYKWICGAGSCIVERPTDPEGSTNLQSGKRKHAKRTSKHTKASNKDIQKQYIINALKTIYCASRAFAPLGRDLKCWGEVALQQSDLSSGYINIKNHIQDIHDGRPRDFLLRAHLVPIRE